MLTLTEVERAAGEYNVIPLVREATADLLTPVSALLQLRHAGVPCFLLESVAGGENIARYSFLGVEPFLTLRARGPRVSIEEAGRPARDVRGDALATIGQKLASYRALPVPGLPRFSGGAVGYFAYDCGRYVEDLPDTARDDEGADDVVLMFFDTVLAFDHAAQRIVVIGNVLTGDGLSVAAAYDRASRKIDQVLFQLDRASSGNRLPPMGNHDRNFFRPHMERDEFLRGVRKAQRYIKKGDVFQVVLSQRWERPVAGDPLSCYRMLRRLNPSPYMYYLSWGDGAIAGTSPEMLVRVEGDRLETRPIAGTRPRDADPARDRELEALLLADGKEQAEHIMLVDLGRNDLGRVAVPGSVTVPELMSVERYSHVMHLVSSVRATLRPGVSPLSALMACFPAGTVSGAPKVRAMEIIEEIEGQRRGVYAGAITYFDFQGNLDSCITIRTLVLRQGRALAQAGAGIVMDSDPEREWDETHQKARVLFQAVEAVEPPPRPRRMQA